jgi:hypothetical protein
VSKAATRGILVPPDRAPAAAPLAGPAAWERELILRRVAGSARIPGHLLAHSLSHRTRRADDPPSTADCRQIFPKILPKPKRAPSSGAHK